MELSSFQSATHGWWCDFAVQAVPWTLTRTLYMSPDRSQVAATDIFGYDGRGRTARHMHDSGGKWVTEDVIYDVQGRAVKYTLPHWGTDPEIWGSRTYDALGRLVSTSTPDGEVVSFHWDEVVAPYGATEEPSVRIVDGLGHDRVFMFDALSRLIRVEVPDPASVGSVRDPNTTPVPTGYSYDGNNNVIEMRTGRRESGPFPTRNTQFRRFRYDSLSRLTAQALPECGYHLDDEGSSAGNPLLWSHLFTYDSRSNLTSRKDGRGIVIRYDYGGDPLDRLQRISYDLSDFSDTANPVEPCPDVVYTYAQKGDIRRVASETAIGVSIEDLLYDTAGRLRRQRMSMASARLYHLDVEQEYDSLGRVTALHYPALYEKGGMWTRPIFRMGYEAGGSLTASAKTRLAIIPPARSLKSSSAAKA